jgi:hypothetical protein
MAVFVLLVGWREQAHSAYIWFGSAVAMWATRNLNYWVTNPVIPDLLFAELCVSGEAWFTALFAIFAMRFAELNQPGYKPARWLQPVAIGFALCATLYFVSASSYTRANAGFAVLAGIGMLLDPVEHMAVNRAGAGAANTPSAVGGLWGGNLPVAADERLRHRHQPLQPGRDLPSAVRGAAALHCRNHHAGQALCAGPAALAGAC